METVLPPSVCSGPLSQPSSSHWGFVGWSQGQVSFTGTSVWSSCWCLVKWALAATFVTILYYLVFLGENNPFCCGSLCLCIMVMRMLLHLHAVLWMTTTSMRPFMRHGIQPNVSTLSSESTYIILCIVHNVHQYYASYYRITCFVCKPPSHSSHHFPF